MFSPPNSHVSVFFQGFYQSILAQNGHLLSFVYQNTPSSVQHLDLRTLSLLLAWMGGMIHMKFSSFFSFLLQIMLKGEGTGFIILPSCPRFMQSWLVVVTRKGPKV